MSDFDERIQQSTIRDLIIDALLIDGAHHKQWYLEKIGERLGVDLRPEPEYAYEHGIAP